MECSLRSLVQILSKFSKERKLMVPKDVIVTAFVLTNLVVSRKDQDYEGLTATTCALRGVKRSDVFSA